MGFLAISEIIPPGCVIPFAGTTPPAGWLLCDGTQVSRATYAALYRAIGNAHGSGNGTTTFHLPDYRGRFLRGVDGAAGNDPDKDGRTAMAAGGNAGNAVGSAQDDAFRSHAHGLNSLAGNYGDTAPTSGHPRDSGGQAFGVNTATFGNGGNETRPRNAYVNYIIKV